MSPILEADPEMSEGHLDVEKINVNLERMKTLQRKSSHRKSVGRIGSIA